MTQTSFYFVTDIETNGPDSSRHSMMSFASVVVGHDGEIHDEFEAVLEPRAGYSSDENTMNWWKSQQDAYAAATLNARPAQAVMDEYRKWVKSHSGKRIFAARPLIFDGGWINEYLKTYLNSGIMENPWDKGGLFTGAGLDIVSYMMGVFGHAKHPNPPYTIPQEWLGNNQHSHQAIDDARGYANLLSRLLKIANEQEKHPLDFLD